MVLVQFVKLCSALTQAGHDRGHRVLEDTVLVLKKCKRGTYMTPAVGVRQHRKKRRWGSEAGETRLLQEEHPLVRAPQAQRPMGVRP